MLIDIAVVVVWIAIGLLVSHVTSRALDMPTRMSDEVQLHVVRGLIVVFWPLVVLASAVFGLVVGFGRVAGWRPKRPKRERVRNFDFRA